MVEITKKYVCDFCGRENTYVLGSNDNTPIWITHSDVGDLCPACSKVWDEYKQAFIERMRG